MLEALADRRLLSAINWTIDQAQSYLSLAIPDQEIVINDITVTARVRNQSGGNSGPWNAGNTAAITGPISTNYIDGHSIEFFAGQTNIVGINSGNYRPNPADFDPNATNADDHQSAGHHDQQRNERDGPELRQQTRDPDADRNSTRADRQRVRRAMQPRTGAECVEPVRFRGADARAG